VTASGGLEIVPIAPFAQKKSSETRTRSPARKLLARAIFENLVYVQVLLQYPRIFVAAAGDVHDYYV
jgi:hypothetical protein